jgi:hypothetical protein
VAFTLQVNSTGTYSFALETPIAQPVQFDTSQGAPAPGGPDAVQTFNIPAINPKLSVVFFGVDLAYTVTDSEIQGAIGDGDTDLTEAQLQLLAGDLASGTLNDGDGTYPWINQTEEPNVSASGIGSNNNQFQGAGGGTPIDESFVANPSEAIDSVRVYIDSASGYDPGEVLKYKSFYTDGTASSPSTSGWVTVPTTISTYVQDPLNPDDDDLDGLQYFDIVAQTGKKIDAVQFWMDEGTIRISSLVFTTSAELSADDLFLDFDVTYTDSDGDEASSDFSVGLFGPDAGGAYDVTVSDTADWDASADTVLDDFNFDVLSEAKTYLVEGFSAGDELNLLNSTGPVTISMKDLDGDTVFDDSLVEANDIDIFIKDYIVVQSDVFQFA